MELKLKMLGNYLMILVRAITSKINKVDGAGARHEVDGKCENKQTKETEDGCKIVARLFPELPPKFFPAETPHLGAKHEHQHRYGGQVYAMVYEIVVPQFHIL